MKSTTVDHANDPLLRMQGIVKTFGPLRANDGIDFEVARGEVHALLGENGAGKTTLMRTLIGLYKMDSGKVFWKGKEVNIHTPAIAGEMGLGMVHQQFSLIPTFTVAENVTLATRGHRKALLHLDKVQNEVKKLAGDYGFAIDPTMRIDQLSMGARQRVEILKLLYRKTELLILDEPSSVLTPQEVDDLFKIIDRLVRENRSVIFITHKLDEVMKISHRVTILRDGKVVGKIMTDQASPEKLAHMMVGRDIDFKIKKPMLKKHEPILKVKDLNARWGHGNQQLKNISFEVCTGEIVGIAGVAGNGQEKLVEIISGMGKCDSGQIFIDGLDVTNKSPQQIHKAGLAYIPGDRRSTGLVLGMSVRENAILRNIQRSEFVKNGFIRNQQITNFTKNLIKEFDVRTSGQTASASSLSGGNQQKLVVGRELSGNPKILIAEQPTMGLDVGATAYVHFKLVETRNQDKGVLLVSTDLNETLLLCDRIIVIFCGQIMGEFYPSDYPLQKIGLMMAGTPLQAIKKNGNGK
jgi:ABC-type uncharacterized transport system ATPase subunit